MILACFFVLLTVLFILTFVLPKNEKRTETVTENGENGFYSETTYFYNETDYKEYKNSDSPEAVKYSPEEKFVAAAVKKLYASDDGQFSNDERQYFLSIEMKVTLNKAMGEYEVTGSAKWANEKSFRGEQTAEHTWFDFLGISWGGKKSFVGTQKSIDGAYYNTHAPVHFATCEANSYGGYIWLFEEKTGMYGDAMEYAEASVILDTYNEKKGNETYAKLTYIHTYENAGGIPHFMHDPSGESSQISYNTSGKQWSVELSVGGLAY